MKTTTEILDETLASMEAARYRITIECSYSDTLRIHTKILEAAASLENAIKETKNDDAKHALFISSEHLNIAARAFDVRKLIEQGELAVGKQFNLTWR
jgi:hypothetical protein